MKKLIVFVLDGTIAESKSSLDAEMATLLSALLGIVKVAVISGGDWPQFEKQVLSNLPHNVEQEIGRLIPCCRFVFVVFAHGAFLLFQRFADDADLFDAVEGFEMIADRVVRIEKWSANDLSP